MTPESKWDERIYVTRLTPHRSLTPEDFRCLIVVLLLANAIFSIPFFLFGAWPVAGFMGLDMAAIYVAFKINFRSARAYETVEVTPLELVFAKVGEKGQRAEWRFNPSWVRLEQVVDEEFGPERVSLVSRGQSVEIGSFLGPEQKAELARDLGKALAQARRGVRYA
jgi:uncharacterized membrane protein